MISQGIFAFKERNSNNATVHVKYVLGFPTASLILVVLALKPVGTVQSVTTKQCIFLLLEIYDRVLIVKQKGYCV